jgi:hypothetical protein
LAGSTHPSREGESVITSYEITAVRTVVVGEHPHEHIACARLQHHPALRISRTTIVEDLQNPDGWRYHTHRGGRRIEVVLARCPTCGGLDCIVTLSRGTSENGLLELPRF